MEREPNTVGTGNEGAETTGAEAFDRIADPEKIEALRSFLRFVSSLDEAQTIDRILHRMLAAAARAANFQVAAALVADRRQRLVVRALKGSRRRALLGKRYEAPSVAALLPFYYATDHAEPFVRVLQPATNDLDAAVLVPLVRSGRLLAVLLFGPREEQRKLNPSESEFLHLFANVAATAVETSASHTDLRHANQWLTRRTYQLHTLFEIAREISKARDERSLFRALLTSLCGQMNIRGAAIFLKEGDRFVLKKARGIDLDVNSMQAGVAEALGRSASPAEPADPGLAITKPIATGEDEIGFDYLVPMMRRGETAGLVGVALSTSSDLAEDELQMIATLARNALVVLENLQLRDEMVVKERMERELAIARRIQQTLLPATTPVVEGYEIAGKAIASREVGGDYFDYVPLDDGRLAFVIADVTGKGMPAALMMASVQATLRALASNTDYSCSELIARVNASVHRNGKGENFVTLVYGKLDPRSHLFTSVNAGHCYPLLVRAGGETIELGEGGLLMGLTGHSAYREEEHRLEPGDLLFFFTDGLTDSESASSEDDFFGDQRLRELIRDLRHRNAQAIVDAVLDARIAFSGEGKEHDDTTLVVVKRQR